MPSPQPLQLNVDELMHTRGYNSNTLAAASGVPQPVIHRIRCGVTTNPKIKTLLAMAKALDSTLDQLLSETDVLADTPAKNVGDALGSDNDVSQHVAMQRISIDFPKKIIQAVEQAAAKIGVARTALIKMWIADRLSKT